MKAIVQHSYGSPAEVLKLDEVPRPEVGNGEVLVRVMATSVNTPDWLTVTGTPAVLRLLFGVRGPKVVVRGTDLAGVVEVVGPGVDDFQPGDEVFGSGWDNSARRGSGTFAEYALAPASQLIRKPASLSFEEAAGSVMSGLTALIAMRDVGGVKAGMRVLINGASGGVGTFAVQIAKAAGAEVTGVCSGGNAELVRGLGADRVIDYTVEDVTSSPERFDVILDNVLNHPSRAMARLLAPGGLLIPNSVGGTDGTMGRLLGGLPRIAGSALLGLGRRRVSFVTCEVTRPNLDALVELMESKDVRVVIDEVYELDRAARAVEHMLGHHACGKIVITVP